MVSGVAGSAGALVWSPTQPTVGASGAIFGILGALFVLERRGSISTGGQVAGMIVLNLVITFTLSSVISVGGHVGGLIGGAALMWMMLHFRRSNWAILGSGAAVVAISVVIAYAKVRNLQ
jgi:membrane associated rhomboid family serine protease